VSQQAERVGRQLKVRVRLSSFDVICQMVEGGARLAIVPQATARRWQRFMALRMAQLTDPWAVRHLAFAQRSISVDAFTEFAGPFEKPWIVRQTTSSALIGQLLMSVVGPSRNFAASQNLVAIGGIASLLVFTRLFGIFAVQPTFQPTRQQAKTGDHGGATLVKRFADAAGALTPLERPPRPMAGSGVQFPGGKVIRSDNADRF
jgi:hypothetical protein